MRPVRQFDEWFGMRLCGCGQIFHFGEFGFRFRIAVERAQKPAQAVMSIRFGWVDPNCFAPVFDGTGGITFVSEQDAQIEMRKADVFVQNQGLPHVLFG
jgi:hypothetical protein